MSPSSVILHFEYQVFSMLSSRLHPQHETSCDSETQMKMSKAHSENNLEVRRQLY